MSGAHACGQDNLHKLTSVWLVVNHPFSLSLTLTSFKASSVRRCSLSAMRPPSSAVSMRTFISESPANFPPGSFGAGRFQRPNDNPSPIYELPSCSLTNSLEQSKGRRQYSHFAHEPAALHKHVMPLCRVACQRTHMTSMHGITQCRQGSHIVLIASSMIPLTN